MERISTDSLACGTSSRGDRDGTEDGSKLQIFSVTTKEVQIITFNTFLSGVATASSTRARNGEVFVLHFE
jgi:hypothetical protein